MEKIKTILLFVLTLVFVLVVKEYAWAQMDFVHKISLGVFAVLSVGFSVYYHKLLIKLSNFNKDL